ISARDGSILFRKNLTSDAKDRGKVRSNGFNDFTYRVWAATSGNFLPSDGPQGNSATPKVNPVPDGFQAPYVAPSDVTLTNAPFSRSATDPWLPVGATVTNGNNVDAYVDLDENPTTHANDGLTGSDFRASVTAPGQFLHTYDPTQLPTSTEQRNAALQQLFYDDNFLHDWYYDFGFDEQAGNAQADNYGRGGAAGDSMRAEGQDGGARNNANMSTPADGGRPRMQMYVFDANTTRYLQVNSPAAIAGFYTFATAAFGAQTFNVTGDLLYPATNQLGCAAFTAGLFTGKIALIDRGTCGFTVKVKNAQDAGAIAVLVANSAAAFGGMAGVDATITIPSYITTQGNGNAIKAQLATPTTVNVTMRRDAGIDRDGTIDNQIIFHEWAHYLSNRLIANAAGLGQAQARGMGEGWSDFNAMLGTVRPDDTTVPSNATWNGVYALASYVTGGDNGNGGGNDAYYWGIRRYPYSTDMTKNPLTFRHIANGVALPAGPPVGFGASGVNNAEVHNVGEVWANTLWECYAALLRDTQGGSPRLTFPQAQDRMKGYLVSSLKMTPGEPTLVEARDAMLAVAYANDGVDYVEFWQAFAKRGLGVGAVAPDRYSVTHTGAVTESFAPGSDLQFVSAKVDDSVNSCDGDGYLDAGDTGKFTFTLRNLGTLTLTGTTGTVTSSNPNVVIANGGAITFAPSDGSQTTTGSVNVSIPYGAAGVQTIDYSLSFTDPALSIAGPRNASGALRGNVNLIPSATATDDVEAPTTKWTTSANPLYNQNYPWAIRAISETSHQWHAPDVNGLSDQYLTSPVMTVNGGGSLNLQFDHSFSFEFDGGGNYDGGKVEMSVNGGAWSDIGAAAYNGSIL
ncbi:MAG: Peptidase, (Fungalysin) family, partial [Acidobacteria bacterium]|nr:Peptidase, (Fungalysin) family [Acidobacteriota bacterium]